MLAAGGLDIADAFSTDPYTGNGGTQTITNGVDLSGEGGLVWVKIRDAAYGHRLVDTERGASLMLQSNATTANISTPTGITSFNSDGFSLGNNVGYNQNTNTFVAWTFRKAPKFFDVVTYTGDGVAGRTVAHDLGQDVGMIIVKRTNATGGWAVYHQANTAAPETDYLSINLTNATADDATYWNDTAPTDSVFTVGTNSAVNASGGTYVAYLFAHDTDASSVIQCGSYTGNGSATGPVVTLGWEPQWLMIKSASTSGSNWELLDSARGLDGVSDKRLYANLSNAEGTFEQVETSATGFNLVTAGPALNVSSTEYIYMAIRKEGA
jgi:hypothetical protein